MATLAGQTEIVVRVQAPVALLRSPGA